MIIPRNCNFCGLCCALTVKLTEKEIKDIESLGYNRKDFTEEDEPGSKVIKRPNSWCYFLESKDNKGTCKIYEKRPHRCREFPDKELCDLKDNVIFNDMSNKHPNVKLLWKRAPKKNDPLPKKEPEFPV
ncbi:hypothetical protein CMO88_01375 [Candidatus Woesearchaeota archaeon]|nr:hypothetical protein [Candidatus Woesearchaeota archaeon]|tara:strand:+ start:23233 stop:23619 length:387 start_codon:yes stop_codon:yes gene_type:complete